MRTHHYYSDIGKYNLTNHAKVRLQQRGLSTRHIELVMAHGIPVNDGYVMTRNAARDRIAELKQEMKDIERLENVMVVDLNGDIATAYRVGDQRIRRMTGK